MEIKTEVVLEFKNHRIHLTTGELKQLRDFIDRQIAYLSPVVVLPDIRMIQEDYLKN